MSRKEGVRGFRFRLDTYDMSRKVAGPINIKAALRMRLPTITNAGARCGCGKKNNAINSVRKQEYYNNNNMR